MDELFRALFYLEEERGPLGLALDRTYQDKLPPARALFAQEEFPQEVFDLLDAANLVSFTHGVRVGLRLAGNSAQRRTRRGRHPRRPAG